ncbi:MAG: [Eubacterium sp.]|nr:[FeFe] hydrogenase H-cluster maturation GTPase HydF [Eubacterium sp.]
MGLNSTPMSERAHIGFFGLRNAGKSSLVNSITNQSLSLVSNVKGTTTDLVKKSMELLPFGPVVIIDTPGIDDTGELGSKRVEVAKSAVGLCDIAVLITENDELKDAEKDLIKAFKMHNTDYIVVKNKSDINVYSDGIYVSALTGEGVDELKGIIASRLAKSEKHVRFIADFIFEGDTVILVTPIDESAPKGRMILPQQLAIRDIIDFHAKCIVVQVEELSDTINMLKESPALVVTDSQAFERVMKIVPPHIPLTSFSILMARYKGFLNVALEGAKKLDTLKNNDKILIAEGCTHRRQCGDIGTVKLPKWIKAYTGKKLHFDFTSGHGFEGDLTGYALVIHCGGCMLGDKEMQSRRDKAIKQGVGFTNYGTVIAKINGILERSTEIIEDK